MTKLKRFAAGLSSGSRNTKSESPFCPFRRFLINNRIYYQHQPSRLSACPVTVHALLHIADSIRAMGPVWAYWAFAMERFCGTLKRSIRSRRFPLASLERFVLERVQLDQIANIYNIVDDLALRSRPTLRGIYSHPDCTGTQSCIVIN
jgi:hypothetical protein